MILNPPFGAAGSGGGGPPATQTVDWRVYINSVQNAGNQAEISGMELRSVPGGSNLASGGTPSASSSENSPSLPASNGFSTTSFAWRSDDLEIMPAWLGYTMPSAATIRELVLGTTAAAGVVSYNPQRAPIDFELQYNPGSGWITRQRWTPQMEWFYISSGDTFGGQSAVRFTVGVQPTYYRVRVLTTHGNGYTSILACELHSSISGSNVAVNGGAWATTYDNSSTVPSNPFAGIVGSYGTGWASLHAGYPFPQDLMYGFFYPDPGIVEAKITVVDTGNIYGEPSSWPATFSIDKITGDPSGTWTQLYVTPSPISWVSGVAQSFSW